MKLRSLFLAVAGALILTTALVPKANATVIVYFNFEDGTEGTFPDITSDQIPAAGGDNPGGGIHLSTLSISGSNDVVSVQPGLSLNRTAGDDDVPPKTPDLALSFFHAKNNPGAEICFFTNTTGLTDLSLSFAVDNAGNGYNRVDLTVTNSNGTFTDFRSITTSTSQLITFDLPNSLFVGTPGETEFCLTFTGGQSNGVNRQTVIDNIVLGGTIVPEPATVVGGLLGVCGLCWHQRRRLIRSVRLRHA
jgi:hypothetical protein